MGTYTMANSADDGESNGGTWNPRTDVGDDYAWKEYHLCGEDSGQLLKAGYRFQNVTVDNSSAYSAATLNINVAGNDQGSDMRVLTVKGHSPVDQDGGALSASFHPAHANWDDTTASATFSTDGTVEEIAIDVQSIIDEIVDHDNWASGEDINIRIGMDTGTYRRFRLVDYDPDTTATVAELVLTPAAGGGGEPIVLRAYHFYHNVGSRL